jgi:hypothetical protein
VMNRVFRQLFTGRGGRGERMMWRRGRTAAAAAGRAS